MHGKNPFLLLRANASAVPIFWNIPNYLCICCLRQWLVIIDIIEFSHTSTLCMVSDTLLLIHCCYLLSLSRILEMIQDFSMIWVPSFFWSCCQVLHNIQLKTWITILDFNSFSSSYSTGQAQSPPPQICWRPSSLWLVCNNEW